MSSSFVQIFVMAEVSYFSLMRSCHQTNMSVEHPAQQPFRNWKVLYQPLVSLTPGAQYSTISARSVPPARTATASSRSRPPRTTLVSLICIAVLLHERGMKQTALSRNQNEAEDVSRNHSGCSRTPSASCGSSGRKRVRRRPISP